MATDIVDTDEGAGGIDRRTLIRRAAVVGAAAWTAPVIIGSLTSPAAAVTGICGCTQIRINGNCNENSQSATGTCAPILPCPGTESEALFLACIQVPEVCDGEDDTVVFSINPGCDCVFQTATARHNGNDCQRPPPLGQVMGIGTQTVTFPEVGGSGYIQFFLNVDCTPCPT